MYTRLKAHCSLMVNSAKKPKKTLAFLNVEALHHSQNRKERCTHRNRHITVISSYWSDKKDCQQHVKATKRYSEGQDRHHLCRVSYLRWRWGPPSQMLGRTLISAFLPVLLPLHCTTENDFINTNVYHLSS